MLLKKKISFIKKFKTSVNSKISSHIKYSSNNINISKYIKNTTNLNTKTKNNKNNQISMITGNIELSSRIDKENYNSIRILKNKYRSKLSPSTTYRKSQIMKISLKE